MMVSVRPSARRSGLACVLALGAAVLTAAEAGDEPRRDVPAAPSGARDYAAYCAVCHGERGRGDGPLAALLGGPLEDLTTLSRRNGGRFPLDKVRRAIDGRRPPRTHGAMPAWGEAFREPAPGDDRARDRIAQIASFLASIQREAENPGAGAASALCVFANPAYAGRCTEAVRLPEGSSPREACDAILACLNGAACVRTYCLATAVRQDWTLESARRVVESLADPAP